MVRHMPRSSAYLECSRHQVYYFRIRVPLALRNPLSCSHIRRSLKTRCRREAVMRGAVLLEQVNELFNQALKGLEVCLSVLSWERPQALTEIKKVPRKRSKPPVKQGPKLSEVLIEYLKEQRLQGVGEKTIGDKKSVVELLILIIGDLTLKKVERHHARKFKNTALKLPPRIGQHSKKPLEKMIAESESTISITTFNNYVKNLNTIFIYAVREGYSDINPFEGMKIQQTVKANTQRSRFTEEDLSRILTFTSAYKGQEKTYRYWLPLLGLYTGARMNELCQLYLDDIVQFDDIDCLHIQAKRPDQKLKNLSSERVIPIHSELKDLGFLSFIETQRSLGHSRVFPELSLHQRHGYIQAPSRWFASVREQLGFKGGEDKKDFHSFRHTVADQLKQQGIAESLIGGILGHTSGGMTFTRYGKDYKPEVLAPVVELLKFVGLVSGTA